MDNIERFFSKRLLYLSTLRIQSVINRQAGPKELKVKCVTQSSTAKRKNGRLLNQGWRDGTVVRVTDCLQRTQVGLPPPPHTHTHDGSQPPAISVPGDLVPSSDLYRELHRQTDIHVDKTIMY